MPKNKVKFGLKNVHWAKVTFSDDGTPIFGTVHAWPGAVNMSLEAQGEPTNFRADDIEYYVVNNNQGYSGDFESALIPDLFRKEILLEIEDSNGVLVEDADAPSVHFALMFEFTGDKRNIRHVVYNNTATRPGIASKTKEDSVEVQTEKLTITSRPVFFAALGKNVVKASSGDNVTTTAYNNWYNSVYQPNTLASTVSISGPSTVVHGNTITLAASTYPAEANVVWSSNDETVATVDDGVVTGVAAGGVVIMAQLASDSSVYDTRVITVT